MDGAHYGSSFCVWLVRKMGERKVLRALGVSFGGL